MTTYVAKYIFSQIAAAVTTPFDVIKTHQQTAFGEETIYGGRTIFYIYI